MKKKIRVLWIDDGAIVDLRELAGPVYASGRYELVIATNVSEAIERLEEREFHVVIVDIRIPPGERKEWRNLYLKSGESRVRARLGLDLLDSCLGPRPQVKIPRIPDWITPRRFGVFTVEGENEVMADLTRLGVRVFKQKEADPPRRTLVDLIEDILTALPTDAVN